MGLLAEVCLRNNGVEEIGAYDITKDVCCAAKRPDNEKKNQKLEPDCAITGTPAMHLSKKHKRSKPDVADDHKEWKIETNADAFPVADKQKHVIGSLERHFSTIELKNANGVAQALSVLVKASTLSTAQNELLNKAEAQLDDTQETRTADLHNYQMLKQSLVDEVKYVNKEKAGAAEAKATVHCN